MQYIAMMLFILVNQLALAFVPTVDIFQQAEEAKAISSYLQEVQGLLTNITEVNDTAKQIADLQQIIYLQQKVAQLCVDICTTKAQWQIGNYLQSLDNTISTQFTQITAAVLGVQNTINDLQGIVDFFNNLGSNTQQASLSLQQAVVKVNQRMQLSLSQIQVLMFEQSQQQIMQQKLEKSVTNETYAGFYQSGL